MRRPPTSSTKSSSRRAARAKIAAQGLTGLSVPESFGGMGMSDVDWALVTQELGYYAIPDSLSETAFQSEKAMPAD